VSLTTAEPGDTGAAGATLDYASPRDRVRVASTGVGCLPIGKPLSTRWLIFVALFCATMLLPTLGGRRVLTRHEVFAAEPAREMLHGPAINWIIPHFAGIPRTVKPPTTSWLIAGSMALSHSEAEWVVRLPSALSAILMTVLIADLAARWLGPRVGMIAGLMQATFVYFLVQARLAEADMPMAAAVCLAMYAFARGTVLPAGVSDFLPPPVLRGRAGEGVWTGSLPPESPLPNPPPEYRERGQEEPSNSAPWGGGGLVRSADPTGISRLLPILFYLGAGLSFLFKGVGLAFILAACVAFIASSAIEGRDWRRCARFFLSPVGLLLLAVLLVAWPAAAWHADPNIFKTFRREILGRASGEFGERQPWYFYAGVVPCMLMPWLPFGFGAIIQGVRRGALHGPVGQFLLCWFVPGLLILSASAWKHHHYVIPMMPPATLVIAAGMELWVKDLKRHNALSGALLWFVGWMITAALVWRFAKTGRNELVVTVVLLAFCGAVVIYVARRQWTLATIVAVFGTAWVVSFALGFAILPAFEDYRWSAELAKRANYEVPPDQPIYLLNLKEHNTAFYLRLPVIRADDVDAFDLNDVCILQNAYALCPKSFVSDMQEAHLDVIVLDSAKGMHKTDRPGDKPVLVKLSTHPPITISARSSLSIVRRVLDLQRRLAGKEK